MSTLYLAWRAPGQRWYPVGRLTRDLSGYVFRYTQGALAARRDSGFRPLVAFPDLAECYRSPDLFAVFAGRIPIEKPEVLERMADWAGLGSDREDLLVILARTMGCREADAFEVFSVPEPGPGGCYAVHFFLHGLRHRSAEAIERAQRLSAGERLAIYPEPENPTDRLALRLLAPDPPVHVGYVPRFLAPDLNGIGLERASVEVSKVNPSPAPAQFRVLCRVTAPWPEGFRPYSGEIFQPIRGHDDESQCMEAVEREAGEAAEFFSEKGRFRRERAVCMAALRLLGLGPDANELAPGDDPPDVLFREARFEVTALYDDGRKPHEDWRREAARRSRAFDLGDLMKPYRPRDPVGLGAVADRLREVIAAKCVERSPKLGKGYTQDQRELLDLVVYLDRGQPPVLLGLERPPPGLVTELEEMRWRSVTLVTNVDCSVVVASAAAPSWLREREGGVFRANAEQLEGLFAD